MGLSSNHLEAFVAIAKKRSFSRAAESINITQSALSQRIINLETELGTALVIRETGGLRLTAAGEELLRFCQAKEALEMEALGRIKDHSGVIGSIRIASFSSLTRSVILPIISKYVQINPKVRIELLNREIRELKPLLMSNEVDFIVTNLTSQRFDWESHFVGEEHYVLARSKSRKECRTVFLDHDAEDSITQRFVSIQKKKVEKLERDFLDEVYALIDGVALGLGQGVLPRHLIYKDSRLRIESGLIPLKVPVYLQYFRQPFYSQLHQDLIRILTEEIGPSLSS